MLGDLVLLLALLLFTWYIQFHWKRRNLYKEAAKIKGPAGWPVIGNILVSAGSAAQSFEYFVRLGSIYPQMCKLWFGPHLVICVYNPEALEVILNSPKALAKSQIFYKFLKPSLGSSLVTAPVSIWKRHRRIINPSFNQQILNGFMDTFSDQCTILVDQLKQFADKGEFDICDTLSKCAVDATCETIMGTRINQQRSNSNFQYVVHRISEISYERIGALLYHLDLVFRLTKLAKEYDDLNKQFHDFVGEVIRKKRQLLNSRTQGVTQMKEHSSKRKPFLELLLENSDFTEKELNDEVRTFMVGSSDTVSLAAGFILIMLGMHGDIQDKVLEEVLNVIGPDRQVKLEDLPHLKYIERVIKETLRLFPGFPFVFRYLSDDIPFTGEQVFPKGSTIFVSILTMHRMDKYWPDPLTFNPDRFLPEEVANRHPYCFLPFSAGPRNCIGYKYGLMILKTMIASVVRTYKISTRFKKVEDVEIKCEVTTGSKHGFPVVLETR